MSDSDLEKLSNASTANDSSINQSTGSIEAVDPIINSSNEWSWSNTDNDDDNEVITECLCGTTSDHNHCCMDTFTSKNPIKMTLTETPEEVMERREAAILRELIDTPK